MKHKVILYCLIFICTALGFINAAEKFYTPTPITFKIPAAFPKPEKDIFQNNALTEEGFQLGKKLFYDASISKNGEISCASCHQPFAAFSTFDHDLSHGVNNTFSTRNAPALINLAWMKEWQWDGGVNHLEVQALAPMTAANEMGEHIDSIMHRIRRDAGYKKMFKSAFSNTNITTANMLKALTQFTGSLVSADSKYDKVKRGQAKFIEPEQKGYEIFLANCNSCHREPLFTNNDFRNNGMTLNRFNDAGRQAISLVASDSLKFKVPTLRNIALTFPYMHDGRIGNLTKVLDHYTNLDTSIKNLDPLLKRKIQMNDKDKKQLLLFLYTLTDTAFTKNKRYLP